MKMSLSVEKNYCLMKVCVRTAEKFNKIHRKFQLVRVLSGMDDQGIFIKKVFICIEFYGTENSNSCKKSLV